MKSREQVQSVFGCLTNTSCDDLANPSLYLGQELHLRRQKEVLPIDVLDLALSLSNRFFFLTTIPSYSVTLNNSRFQSYKMARTFSLDLIDPRWAREGDDSFNQTPNAVKSWHPGLASSRWVCSLSTFVEQH